MKIIIIRTPDLDPRDSSGLDKMEGGAGRDPSQKNKKKSNKFRDASSSVRDRLPSMIGYFPACFWDMCSLPSSGICVVLTCPVSVLSQLPAKSAATSPAAAAVQEEGVKEPPAKKQATLAAKAAPAAWPAHESSVGGGGGAPQQQGSKQSGAVGAGSKKEGFVKMKLEFPAPHTWMFQRQPTLTGAWDPTLLAPFFLPPALSGLSSSQLYAMHPHVLRGPSSPRLPLSPSLTPLA